MATSFATESQNNVEDSSETKINAQLRENFLRLISRLGDKEVEFRMFEKMNLRGKFISLQKNQKHVLVDDLCTPTGVVKHSALRVKDIVSIKIPVGELDARFS